MVISLHKSRSAVNDEAYVRAKQMWDYYISLGENPNSVAGKLGNCNKETGGTFDPNQRQSGGGSGYGLYQWKGSIWPIVGGQTWDGKEYVQNIADAAGVSDPFSVTGQCEVEIWSSYNGQWLGDTSYDEFISGKNYLNEDLSAESAALLFLQNFERAGEEGEEDRQTYARYWYDQFIDTEVEGGNSETEGEDVTSPGIDTENKNPDEDTSEGGGSEGNGGNTTTNNKNVLSNGTYYLRNNGLYSLEKNGLIMTRFNDHLFTKYNTTKVDNGDVTESNTGETEDNTSDGDKTGNAGGTGTGSESVDDFAKQEIINKFIKELESVPLKSIRYDNIRPQLNPNSCGWADCSGYIGWCMRDLLPDAWNNGYCNTVTLYDYWMSRGIHIGTWDTMDKLRAEGKPIRGDIMIMSDDTTFNTGMIAHIVAYMDDNNTTRDVGSTPCPKQREDTVWDHSKEVYALFRW